MNIQGPLSSCKFRATSCIANASWNNMLRFKEMHIELHFSSLRALNLCGLLLTEHEGEHTRDPALTERRTPPAAHRESPANQPSAGPGSRRGATGRRTPGRAVSTSAKTRPSGTLSDRRAPVRRDGTCRTQRASVCKMQECASRGLFMTNFRIPTWPPLAGWERKHRQVFRSRLFIFNA